MKTQKMFVVKIGSSVLLTNNNELNDLQIAHIADQIAYLRKKGIGIVLVISGAVACGSKFITPIQNRRILKQVSAGIGQVKLTSKFNEVFNRKGLKIAQMLFKRSDIKDSRNKKNFSHLIRLNIKLGFIPFINENDVIELNSFKGNDFLGAEIALMLKSDKYIILSTMKGSAYGIGGKKTKLEVINNLKKKSIKGVILNGKIKNILVSSVL